MDAYASGSPALDGMRELGLGARSDERQLFLAPSWPITPWLALVVVISMTAPLALGGPFVGGTVAGFGLGLLCRLAATPTWLGRSSDGLVLHTRRRSVAIDDLTWTSSRWRTTVGASSMRFRVVERMSSRREAPRTLEAWAADGVGTWVPRQRHRSIQALVADRSERRARVTELNASRAANAPLDTVTVLRCAPAAEITILWLIAGAVLVVCAFTAPSLAIVCAATTACAALLPPETSMPSTIWPFGVIARGPDGWHGTRRRPARLGADRPIASVQDGSVWWAPPMVIINGQRYFAPGHRATLERLTPDASSRGT